MVCAASTATTILPALPSNVKSCIPSPSSKAFVVVPIVARPFNVERLVATSEAILDDKLLIVFESTKLVAEAAIEPVLTLIPVPSTVMVSLPGVACTVQVLVVVISPPPVKPLPADIDTPE